MSDDRPSVLAAALRWGLALGLAAGGALGARACARSVQARAARNVVRVEHARFEGCLWGEAAALAPARDDAAATTLARRLALGEGEPAWPHACAQALARLEGAAHAVALEDPRERGLEELVRGAQNAVGQGVFWARHQRAGRRDEPAAWLGPVFALRASVERYLRAGGASPAPPERTRDPRRLAAEGALAPPPTPTALPRGAEADLVSSYASATRAAVLLRDDRSRYAVCARALDEAGALWRCGELDLAARGADPEGVAFVPGDGPPRVLARARPPERARLVLHDGAPPTPWRLEGDAEPAREVWGDAQGVYWFDDDARTLRRAPERTPHPALGATVVSSARVERAVLGFATGAGLAWLEGGARATLHLAGPQQRAASIALAATGRGDAADRGLRACGAGDAAWLLVGHRRAVDAYRATPTEQGGLAVERVGALLYAPPLERAELRCSAGALFVRDRSDRNAVAPQRCLAPPGACGPLPSLDDRVREASSWDAAVTREGGLVLARAQGDALEVFALDASPAARATPVALALPPLPARRVRLELAATAQGPRAVLFASGTVTQVWEGPPAGPLAPGPVALDEAEASAEPARARDRGSHSAR